MSLYYPRAAVVLDVTWENRDPTNRNQREMSRFFLRPMSVRVGKNSYAEADTFDATFAYKDFPFDPRAMRSVGVIIHMDNVKNLETDLNVRVAEGLVGDERERRLRAVEETVVFQGFVDDARISHDGTERLVTIEGRDNTALFLDRKRFKVPLLAQSIRQFMITILAQMGESVNKGKIKVVFDDPSDGDKQAQTAFLVKKNSAISKELREKAAAAGLNRVILKAFQERQRKLGTPEEQIDEVVRRELDKIKDLTPAERAMFEKSKKKREQGSITGVGTLNVRDQERTYWDVIHQVALRNGLIAYIHRNELRFKRPRNYYGENPRRAHFMYGNNITDLSFTRKIGRRKEVNIRLVGYDKLKKRAVEVFIPRQATAKDLVARYKNMDIVEPELDANNKPTDRDKDPEFMTFPVSKFVNRADLITLAEQTFYQVSRQQIEGSFMTSEMEFRRVDYDRNTNEPVGDEIINFRELEIGDNIRVGFHMEDLEKIKDIADIEERVSYLRGRGYPDEIARSFAIGLDAFNYNFYLASFDLSLDANGFQINMDMENLIEIKRIGDGV